MFSCRKIVNSLLTSIRREREREREHARILYVVNSLEHVGGVETRLRDQFEYLAAHGIMPIVLCERNACPSMFRYPLLQMDYSAENAEELLYELVALSGADAVEFQLKSPRLVNSVNLSGLKQIARVGACIHGETDVFPRQLLQTDYYFGTAPRAVLPKEALIIRNWIKMPRRTVSPSPESRKALFVSRIDNEKFPTVKNFVSLCRACGFSFSIAGSIKSGDEVLHRKLQSLHLPPDALAGPIETHAFLSAHGGEYAFVAGVGQVPLEAAAFGIPGMVIPHKDNWRLATVLTEENFSFLREWNMVIKVCPDSDLLGNVETFLEDRTRGDMKKYDLRELVRKNCSIDAAMAVYLDAVYGRSRSASGRLPASSQKRSHSREALQ